MQPYQKAAENLRESQEFPLRLAKNAALTFGGSALATTGAHAINKLIPAVGAMISPYVPDKLMEAGLSKIDPRFGGVIQTALNQGYTFDDIRNFFGQKVEESQAQQSAKQEKNLIEQYSPELHQFISEQIGQGRNAYQAGAIAQKDKRFVNAIQKLTKDHKISWADIIEQVYGQNPTVKKKPGVVEQERERFNEAYGGQQQSQQGLDPAVAQILQQGAQILQRFQGQ